MTESPQATVAAIITASQKGTSKVLLTLRDTEPFKGHWCLPGGHIERYETALTAVSRELKEETGLDFSGRFFASFDEILPDKGIHAVVLAYTGQGMGELIPQTSEVAKISWFAFDQALDLPLGFDHARILEAYVRNSVLSEPGSGTLSECSGLRAEILKRIEMRQQMLIYTVIFAGSLMTLGVQLTGRLPLLLFPVLAFLLAVVWMHSDVRIGEIGEYIRDRIAPRFGDLGDWELYIRQKNSRRRFRPVELSALGVFLVTELLSVALAIVITPDSLSGTEWILLLLDALAIGGTLAVVWTRSRLQHGGSVKGQYR
jgi:8-oxo-dGTP diphosphatase